jgi:hypothetical protein
MRDADIIMTEILKVIVVLALFVRARSGHAGDYFFCVGYIHDITFSKLSVWNI